MRKVVTLKPVNGCVEIDADLGFEVQITGSKGSLSVWLNVDVKGFPLVTVRPVDFPAGLRTQARSDLGEVKDIYLDQAKTEDSWVATVVRLARNKRK
jgi:hypothetical protein